MYPAPCLQHRSVYRVCLQFSNAWIDWYCSIRGTSAHPARIFPHRPWTLLRPSRPHVSAKVAHSAPLVPHLAANLAQRRPTLERKQVKTAQMCANLAQNT
jgi:hypothetical protein